MCGSFLITKNYFMHFFPYLKILKATCLAIIHQSYACQSICLLSFMPRCIREKKMLYDSHWWHSSTISLIICFLWAFFNFFSASFKKSELKPQPDIPHKKNSKHYEGERNYIISFLRNLQTKCRKNIYLYVHKRKEIKNYFKTFFCTY